MKKLLSALLCSVLLAGCANTTEETASKKESATSATTSEKEDTTSSVATVDTVTGASTTRTALSGDDYDTAIAIKDLEAISNDLATKAETEEKGYEEPENAKLAQVLSVNDDGTPSMSTIHAWKVDGDKITVVMTDGRTISNLIQVGCKGTILIHGDAWYILHVTTSDVKTLEYTDEAYESGKFNSAYSGASNKLNEYTVSFDITELESTMVYMFD